MGEVKFRFKKFKVYQDAKNFCKFCREIVDKYIEPRDRDLASQIKRALHSLVLNIAEGSAIPILNLPGFWEFRFVQSMKRFQVLIWPCFTD